MNCSFLEIPIGRFAKISNCPCLKQQEFKAKTVESYALNAVMQNIKQAKVCGMYDTEPQLKPRARRWEDTVLIR